MHKLIIESLGKRLEVKAESAGELGHLMYCLGQNVPLDAKTPIPEKPISFCDAIDGNYDVDHSVICQPLPVPAVDANGNLLRKIQVGKNGSVIEITGLCGGSLFEFVNALLFDRSDRNKINGIPKVSGVSINLRNI
jgi:hypothetical protein